LIKQGTPEKSEVRILVPGIRELFFESYQFENYSKCKKKLARNKQAGSD